MLKELRDEQAGRLARLKAERAEAQRAGSAEPPTPEELASPEPEGAPSRTLLSS